MDNIRLNAVVTRTCGSLQGIGCLVAPKPRSPHVRVLTTALNDPDHRSQQPIPAAPTR